MDAETAALFPREFEDSELGQIPKGWRVGRVNDIAMFRRDSVNPSRSPKTLFEHFSIPAYDTDQIPIVERGSEIKSNKYVVHPNAILQSRLNPRIRRVWLTGTLGENPVCSTEFLVWLPCEHVSREYIYCMLTSSVFSGMVEGLVTGTSGSHQRVRPDHVANIEVVIPPNEVMRAFGQVAATLFARMLFNREQLRILANLRDTLLPRLISGKLRIPEAEAIVEEALP